MSAEERESASIKVVQRLLQEKHSVSEDTLQQRKREIKDLFRKELELAELSRQARDVVRAMSAEERESASIKLLQKLLQEKHSVSEDTVQECKREIKDLFLKELKLAREEEEEEKEEDETEEEESNERETKTPVRKSSFCMCMCFFLLLIRNREWPKSLRGAFSSELVWMCVCLWGICLLFLFHF
jgi:cation transport ATPase